MVLSIFVVVQDSMPLKGGRGSASMVQKCKLCSRENSIGMGHFAISQSPLLCQTTYTVIKNTQTPGKCYSSYGRDMLLYINDH